MLSKGYCEKNILRFAIIHELMRWLPCHRCSSYFELSL